MKSNHCTFNKICIYSTARNYDFKHTFPPLDEKDLVLESLCILSLQDTRKMGVT